MDLIEKIKNLLPPTARFLKGQQEIATPLAQIKKGDTIRVLPQEVIPCDGVITSGTTRVDEEVLTGRQVPLHKGKGDFVLAGSFNQDSAISLQLNEETSNNFINKISDELKNAFKKTKKIPNNAWVLTGLFISSAEIISCILHASHYKIYLGIAPLLLISLPFFWYKGKETLETQVLTELFPKGILVRNPEKLQTVAQSQVVFFEKTGTLTEGNFTFSQLFFEDRVNQGALLSILFSLQSKSSHPLSRGVKTHPWHQETPLFPVKNFNQHSGLGISGTVVNGKQERNSAVGNIAFFKSLGMKISNELLEKANTLELIGDTVILCGWNGQAYGLMSFADNLRADFKTTLAYLIKQKITPVLITEDHEGMISHLSYTQELKTVYTRCLPNEKIKKIKFHQKNFKKVIYMGTHHAGIEVNSKLLATANTSILFNANMAPLETHGDILIFGERLSCLSDLISHAKKMSLQTKPITKNLIGHGLVLAASASIPFLYPIFVLGLGLSAWQANNFWKRLNTTPKLSTTPQTA